MKLLKSIKRSIQTAIMLCAAITAAAQKKTDVLTNIRAANAVAIDGKLNEWNDSLQAYNPAAKLAYTIANDDNSLYVVIRASDNLTASRILGRGISLTVNTEGKKKEGPTVIFPMLERTRAVRRNDKADPREIQKEMLARIKEIRVSGFEDIIDGGISLYNEYGIRAAVAYNDKNNLIYELAIPLKRLGLTSSSANEIAYNIKINDLQLPQRGAGMNTGLGGGIYGGGAMRPMDGYGGAGRSNDNGFWIKYKLAKK